ncbi:GNAT family N-acetyltransferase [Desulfovibrio mangrovi]|uniref:GNAT family N-acetyltransferase n=1 Tax=Desulfovibrio mangrovi TaxID=2976983 RepID=UPI002246D424|nr:GNAT family N-acetyltransferase [Desulfovibrio mangrovi]UZP66762.1 GNAT family N-acetyltransferase [Desulfovibrio mangrovi]
MSALMQSGGPPSRRLKQAYLASLEETQELLLEELGRGGQVWTMGDWAYAVVSGGTLVEFYVSDERQQDAGLFFRRVIEAGGVTEVLCKSFNALLLQTLGSAVARAETVGLLFRRIADAAFVSMRNHAFRQGAAADVDAIFVFNDGFFAGCEEIARYVEAGRLYVLESPEGMLGCGIVTPVLPDSLCMDIGMVVAPVHRRKGYGTHIVSYLKAMLLEQGYRPQCGCDAANTASARTLARAGFVCEHSLLRIAL